MVGQLTPENKIEIIYPDSDGQPMADNTKQYQWIVKIKENLEILFASQADIFVGGNLLWYPVEGSNKIRQAPDILVVFGRPKADRGSYQQWKENNIPPQVVFEILSPSNGHKEMAKKLLFYNHYGVEEYYIYDPDNIEFSIFIRSHNWLEEIEEVNNCVSPRLGISFELTADTLEIYYPDGRKFLTSVELDQQREQEKQRAEQEKQRAEQEKQRAEQERQEKETALSQLDTERQRYQDLLAKLQAKGIDLDSL
ncbi:MAG TPA: Uma2 family endonuclease [Nostocaceae cyanobacterium]|nr:Uma2 family endonuclease [Nostocaceae cyanobacterium]